MSHEDQILTSSDLNKEDSSKEDVEKDSNGYELYQEISFFDDVPGESAFGQEMSTLNESSKDFENCTDEISLSGKEEIQEEWNSVNHKIYSSAKKYSRKKSQNTVYSNFSAQQSASNIGDSIELLNTDKKCNSAINCNKDSSYLSNVNDSPSQSLIVTDSSKDHISSNLHKLRNVQCPKVRKVLDADLKATNVQTDEAYCDNIEAEKHAHISVIDFLENSQDFKKKLKSERDLLHVNKIIAEVSSSVNSNIVSKTAKKEIKKLKLLSTEKISKMKSTTKKSSKISKNKISVEKDIDIPKNGSENISGTSSVQNSVNEFLHKNFINGTSNKNVRSPVKSKKGGSIMEMLQKINRNSKPTESLNRGSNEENRKHIVSTKENTSNNISMEKTQEEVKEEDDKLVNNNSSCAKQSTFMDLFNELKEKEGEARWSSVENWYNGSNTVETISSTNETNPPLSSNIMELSGTDDNIEISSSSTSDACGLIKTVKSNNQKSIVTKQEADPSFSPKRFKATDECDTKEFLSLNSSESRDLIKTGHQDHMDLPSSRDDSKCSQFESMACIPATLKNPKNYSKINFGNKICKTGLSGLSTSNKYGLAENKDSEIDVFSKEENLKLILSKIKLRKKESLLMDSSDVDNHISSEKEISPEKQGHTLLSPTENGHNEKADKNNLLMPNSSNKADLVQSHEGIKISTPAKSPQSNEIAVSKNQKKCSSKLKSEQIDSSHATSSENFRHMHSSNDEKSPNKQNKNLCSPSKNKLSNKMKMGNKIKNEKKLNKQKVKQEILSTSLNSCNSLQSCKEIETPRKQKSKSVPKRKLETNSCHQNPSETSDSFSSSASPLKSCQKQSSTMTSDKGTSKKNRKSSVSFNTGEVCNDSSVKIIRTKSPNNLKRIRKSRRLSSRKKSQSLRRRSHTHNNKTSPQNKPMPKIKSTVSMDDLKPLKRRCSSLPAEDGSKTEPGPKAKRKRATSIELSALNTSESTGNFSEPSRKNVSKSSRKLSKLKPRKQKQTASNFVDSDVSGRNVMLPEDTEQNSDGPVILDANQNIIAHRNNYIYYKVSPLPLGSRMLYDSKTNSQFLATPCASDLNEKMITTGTHLNIQPQVPHLYVQESQNKISTEAFPAMPQILGSSTPKNMSAVLNVQNLQFVAPQKIPENVTALITKHTLNSTLSLKGCISSSAVKNSHKNVNNQTLTSTPLPKPNFQSHSINPFLPSVSGLQTPKNLNNISSELNCNVQNVFTNRSYCNGDSPGTPEVQGVEKDYIQNFSLPSVSGLQISKKITKTPIKLSNVQNVSTNRLYSNIVSPGTSRVQDVAVQNYIQNPSQPSVSGLQISRTLNKVPSKLSSNLQNAFTNRSYPDSVCSSIPDIQDEAEEDDIQNPMQYFNKTISVKNDPFDWHCMVYRTSKIDPDYIYISAKDIFSGKFCEFNVRDFFSDSVVYNGLNACLPEAYPYEACFSDYKFPDSFLDEPVTQLLKDFVHFHVKRIYPKVLLDENRNKDMKTVFLTELLKTTLSFGTYFSQVLPLEKTDFTIEDLVECMTLAAIMCIFNEYKKRISVGHC